MSRLLYSATMSLDGFIAGVGGDMSWLSAHVGTDVRLEPVAPDGTGATDLWFRIVR